MLGANQIYEHMREVSQRYTKLKALFEGFGKRAENVLLEKSCPVKGVELEPDFEHDHLFVRFAGKCVRFAFSADLGPNGSGHGFVKCNLVDPVTKTVGQEVGSFSFNGQGETKLKLPPDGDVIYVSSDDGAAYLVLHILNESLGKQ